MTNQKVLLVSILTVVEIGLLVLSSSIMMMVVNAQAQMYHYVYEPVHYNVYPDPKKSSDVNIQKIKCLNSNITVNGLDITQIQDVLLSQQEQMEYMMVQMIEIHRMITDLEIK
jgi:hypothetical protein